MRKDLCFTGFICLFKLYEFGVHYGALNNKKYYNLVEILHAIFLKFVFNVCVKEIVVAAHNIFLISDSTGTVESKVAVVL